MLSALRGIKNRLISLALANRVQLCAPLSRSFSALFSSAFWTCLPVVLLYQCNAFQSVRASDCPVICLLLVSCLSRPKHLSHNKLRYKASPFLGTGLQAFACNWVHFWEWTAKTTVYTLKKNKKNLFPIHLTFRSVQKKIQFVMLSYLYLLSITSLRPCKHKQTFTKLFGCFKPTLISSHQL